MFRHRSSRIDPNRYHVFRHRSDPGIAPVLAGSGSPLSSLGQVAGVAGVGAYQRTRRCAVEGCARVEDDPIHVPADD